MRDSLLLWEFTVYVFFLVFCQFSPICSTCKYVKLILILHSTVFLLLYTIYVQFLSDVIFAVVVGTMHIEHEG